MLRDVLEGDYVDVVELKDHPWFVAFSVILNLALDRCSRIHCLWRLYRQRCRGRFSD